MKKEKITVILDSIAPALSKAFYCGTGRATTAPSMAAQIIFTMLSMNKVTNTTPKT